MNTTSSTGFLKPEKMLGEETSEYLQDPLKTNENKSSIYDTDNSLATSWVPRGEWEGGQMRNEG